VAALLGVETEVEGDGVGLNLVAVVDRHPPRERDRVFLVARETVPGVGRTATVFGRGVPGQLHARSLAARTLEQLTERLDGRGFAAVLVVVTVVDPDRRLDHVEQFDVAIGDRRRVGDRLVFGTPFLWIVSLGLRDAVLAGGVELAVQPDEAGVVTDPEVEGHFAEITRVHVVEVDGDGGRLGLVVRVERTFGERALLVVERAGLRVLEEPIGIVDGDETGVVGRKPRILRPVRRLFVHRGGVADFARAAVEHDYTQYRVINR
jgi:hypothetical protein